MGYQVLARKLRPGTFDGLVGQEHVVRALAHALDHDRLHHAYLFTGTRGVGKTTIARILAKSLNCETGVSSRPCGICSVCTEVNEGRFVDLIEVDAASRTRVDDTRDLLENAQYLPTRGRYKVYLIDEVHMLSASSFNALLKTLEEPPEHVKFLLATTDPKKVPVTVLSRCLQFQLKNISAERIAEYLASVLSAEKIPFEPEALATISKAARGSMRDALSVTDQAIAFGQGSLEAAAVAQMLGLVGRDEVGSLIQALASASPARVLAVIAELADRATDFDTLLEELLAALHQMAVSHALGGQEGDSPRPPFSAEVVQLLYQIALMGYRDLQIAPDPRAGVEMTLLRMLAFAPDDAGLSVPVLQADKSTDPGGPGSEAQGGRAPPASPRAGAPRSESASRSESAPRPVSAPRTELAPRKEPTPRNDGAGAISPVEAAARTPGSEPWFTLVSELELGGVARMLAEHSVLAAQSEDSISLLLDRAHDTLLSDAQVSAVQRALSLRLGREIRLDIEPAELAEETPAQRRQREAEMRQKDAQRLLEQDTTVQSLLSEFGGRLEDVRPLDAGRSSSGKGNPA